MARSKAETVIRAMDEAVRVCGHDPRYPNSPVEGSCGEQFFSYEIKLTLNTYIHPIVCPVCYLKNHRRNRSTDRKLVKQLRHLIKHGT